VLSILHVYKIATTVLYMKKI